MDKEYRVDAAMVADVYTELTKKLFDKRVRKFMAHLRQHELSLNHYSILFLLHQGVSCSSNQLCAQLNVKAASVSYLIDSLEKRGLIERTENPDDRRSQHIALTDEGRRLVGIQTEQEEIARKFASLDPGELELLYLTMKLLRDKWMEVEAEV